MNARTHVSPYLSNSLAIRHEIQRFESVHPSIYAIYDLIELIPDPLLIQQIKEHVVSIEDSFVNSQEWTLSRAVPDLRLGIVGSLSSGKSALVHRYLTGSYMQEESPEGGRFKKEIVVDGQSYLLLIRDEGGPPELQFTSWVDAVIFVFSLENESSFNAIYNYYAKMAHYRNTSEIPLILVGTQDAISESNPRVIDDSRARKLANDLKRCSYYETCATYGLNVERVFQDACQKIAQQRMAAVTPCNSSRPGTPNHSLRSNYYIPSPTAATTTNTNTNTNTSTNNGYSSSHTSNASSSPSTFVSCSLSHSTTGTSGSSFSISGQQQSQSQVTFREPNVVTPKDISWDRADTIASARPTEIRCEKAANISSTGFGANVAFTQTHPPTPTAISMAMPPPVHTPAPTIVERHSHPTVIIPQLDSLPPKEQQPKDLPTPSSTPTTARKTRRRSNLFTPSRKQEENKKLKNGEMGSGRAIPIKQGYLYKRSCKALNKDWKKKYVTLCDDGRLTYHSSLNDYMDDIHGKEIPLMHTTVKIPGQKPRGTKSQSTQSSNAVNGLDRDLSSLSISALTKEKSRDKDILLTAYEMLREGQSAIRSGSVSSACDDAMVISNTSLMNGVIDGNVPSNTVSGKIETPNVKKRHRRMKSSGTKNLDNMDDSDGYEFVIVSLDNKQWHFDAPSTDERECWVQAIEQQILNSLQGNESSKSKSRSNNLVDAAVIQSIRTQVRGNTHCVDCDTPNPDWASLNFGSLVCIECSGIHRNLGSHISRVRSLDLDEWPPWFIKVMTSVGNVMANSIWEGNVRGKAKPTPNSSREEKERWIRAKYEHKEFLIPLSSNVPLPQQLVDAVCKSDVKSVLLLLAHASPEQVNTTVSVRDLRTPLHLAAALGNLAITQLLLWNNASVKSVDHDNRTALTYARNCGSQEVQELLLQNGCPETAPPSGTLPRRKGSIGSRKPAEVFDKLPASVI